MIDALVNDAVGRTKQLFNVGNGKQFYNKSMKTKYLKIYDKSSKGVYDANSITLVANMTTGCIETRNLSDWVFVDNV